MSMRNPVAERVRRGRRPAIARRATDADVVPPHTGIDRNTLPWSLGADRAARPLPAIGGKQARWICEYCYVMTFRDDPPPSWGTVVGTGAVCGDCRERIEGDGGYAVVPAGAYAEGADPRSG